MNSRTFEGKVALVTGGNSGIGLATARLFHRQGAKVIITGRDQNTLNDAAAAIGEGTLALRSDVSKHADLEALFTFVQKHAGKIDVLFANAGVARFASITGTTEALYDEVFDINVKGVFFTIQHSIPYLNDGASIVLNTSFLNKKGGPGTSVYSASKAALRSFVRIAAAELVERGIRVNAVSPGPIATPMYERLGMPQEVVDSIAQRILAQVPMKRFGQSEEVAATVVFLSSPDASYITGVELEVGGGVGQL